MLTEKYIKTQSDWYKVSDKEIVARGGQETLEFYGSLTKGTFVAIDDLNKIDSSIACVSAHQMEVRTTVFWVLERHH